MIDVAAVLGRDFEREQLAALVAARRRARAARRPRRDPAGRRRARPVRVHPRAAAGGGLRPRAATAPARAARARRRTADRALRGARRARAGARRPPLARAVLPARAVPYWEAAGERALRRAAFLEAADHFRRGLEALDEAGALAGDRATLLTQLGASLQAGIGYAAPGVEEAYAEARRTADGRPGGADHPRPVVVSPAAGAVRPGRAVRRRDARAGRALGRSAAARGRAPAPGHAADVRRRLPRRARAPDRGLRQLRAAG